MEKSWVNTLQLRLSRIKGRGKERETGSFLSLLPSNFSDLLVSGYWTSGDGIVGKPAGGLQARKARLEFGQNIKMQEKLKTFF